MKKITQFILAAVLLVLLLPVKGFAADKSPLCFTPVYDSVSVKFDIKNVTHVIQYSTDGKKWSTYISNTEVNLGKGESVCFRAKKNQKVAMAFGDTALDNASRFYITGSKSTPVKCSGNIMSLYGPDCPDLPLQKFAFANMFYGTGCSDFLATAPILPSTSLAEYCYFKMFFSCMHLMSPPILPATTLAGNCYEFMFIGCVSLKRLPALPATTLAEYCYRGMFFGIKLTTLPELPATTLAKGCYKIMFAGCSGLIVNTEEPGREWKIPATATAEDALTGMFSLSGGTMNDTPEVNTTYYIASDKNTK